MIEVLLILFSFNIFSQTTLIDKKYENYLDISFGQGIRKTGDYYQVSGNIDCSFGFLYKYDYKNYLFSSISLGYNGMPIDFKRSLDEKIIDKSFIIEWRRKIDNNILRINLSYLYEKFKQGTSSTFEDNIYNNVRKGLGINYDISYDKGILNIGFIYRNIKFPNYTDLLNEIKNNSYSDDGLYDNNLYKLDFRLKHLNYFTSFSYTIQNYLNQRVLSSDGTYSGSKEKNKSYDFKLGLEEKIYEIYFYPYLLFSIYRSNQNFLRFKSITDINPVFVKDAYSYNEYGVFLPFMYVLKDFSFGFEIKYIKKDYIHRNARDLNNEYLSEKQKDKKTTLTLSISRKIDEISDIVIVYYWLVSSSTNKYDVYLPLNYNSNYIGIEYRIKL